MQIGCLKVLSLIFYLGNFAFVDYTLLRYSIIFKVA